VELKDLNSPVIWQTLFDGDSKQGWMHSGIGVLSDGRIVFEAPGGAALIFLDPATKKDVRIEVGVAVSHGIAVASDDTLFGHPGFTYHGFGGDLGSYIIHIGLKRAKRFTLTSRPFNAQKAYDWGLINEIVPMDELESTTNEIIDDLLKMPFDALVMQKAYYRTVIDAMGMGTNFDAALQTLAFASNIRYEPGENVMVRDRQKGGASAAIKSRKKHYGHL